jgi:uncharacterized protein YlxP (DUF503 family)
LSSNSLKDKRRVIKSGMTRIRNKFNLSVAEVDHQDNRQMTSIALVGVGSDKHIIEQELQQALLLLEQIDSLEIVHADITFV